MVPPNPHGGNSAVLLWRPTKIMNMRDLSNDDDFISHLLVEKLGTGAVPLYVHKMDPSRRLPKTDSTQLLQIVRRLVLSKSSVQNAVRQSVDDLLLLPAIRYYLKSYTQKQINAFATHASRYFELYHPTGSIEIAHTSRYAHKTGKSELCILATRFLAPGSVITELKGSMANLTDEEDRELKRAGIRSGDIRRDFSVIHSKSMKKNHLFLGPARFVNHDCNNNCELFREGRYITFRVLRPINISEEITAHYGDSYFGRKNRHCLCESCEKNGRGGYAPEQDDDNIEPSDSSSNSDESDSETPAPEPETLAPVNVNERRTRRGVYAIVTREEESDESENEEDNKVPLADAEDIPADGEIELTTEVDTASELTSLTPSIPPDPSAGRDPITPVPEPLLARFSSSLSSLSSASDASPRSDSCTPFRSIISTRRQKAQEVEEKPESARESKTPGTGTPIKRLTRSASALLTVEKDKGKSKTSTTTKSTTPSETPKPGRPSTAGNDAVQVKKEEIETRVLRTRPPAPPPPEPRKAPPKPDAPRGADGKILPTCATCHNILPLISVDSKIVWGLGFENGKKKKKHDCPRCLRHFAIYNQPWPRRLPAHGTAFSVTPREESTPSDSNKRVTQKTLPVLDRKLAAAVSAGKRPRKEENTREEEPASKRRKTDGRGTPSIIVKVKPASTSRAQASASTPSLSDKLPLRKAQISANEDTPDRNGYHTESPESGKRKRGRPRLSDKLINTTPSSASSVVKVEETPASIPPQSKLSQPRNTNGRFGRKDTLLKAQQRAARVATHTDSQPSPRKERHEQPKPTRFSPRKKRDSDGHSYAEAESPSRKRKQFLQDYSKQYDNDRDEELALPIQKVLPRRASTFKGASLVSNPNPLRFALQVWANPVLGSGDEEEQGGVAPSSPSSSSEEDDQGPETPEDHLSPPDATIVDCLEQDEAMRDGNDDDDGSLSTAAILSVSAGGVGAGVGSTDVAGLRAPLTYKPSPFTFAKRRWGSVSYSSSGKGNQGSSSAMDVDLKEKTKIFGGGVGGGGGGGGGGGVSSDNTRFGTGRVDRVMRRVQSMHGTESKFAAEEVSDDNDKSGRRKAATAPTSPVGSDNYPPPTQSDCDDDGDEAAVAAAITVEDEDMELVHVYPVVPKAHRHQFLHKSMQFCSHAFTSSTKPMFIDAGWDNTYSGASES